MYFAHVTPYMDIMKKLLTEGKPASGVMKMDLETI